MSLVESAHRVGSVLAGKYVLREPLGAGGMGVVYRADQLILERPVAIKFLHPELDGDPVVSARFQTEARTAARLDHRNTVAVLDFGQDDDGHPYLVMEYVRGRTLRELVDDGAMAPERAIAICAQILAALGEAHRAGIVHADVKSENVLLESRTDGDRVKLVDFGLACVSRSSARDEIPDERWVAGTPEYMAPELIRGDRPTPASDLYAVGIVLYELLTGITPFGGGRSIEIFTRHVMDAPVPPSVRFPDLEVPRALEQVLARSLEKDPSRRYADAESFASELLALRVEPSVMPVPRVRVRSSAPTAMSTTLRVRAVRCA